MRMFPPITKAFPEVRYRSSRYQGCALHTQIGLLITKAIRLDVNKRRDTRTVEQRSKPTETTVDETRLFSLERGK